jgi:hypothetical protein
LTDYREFISLFIYRPIVALVFFLALYQWFQKKIPSELLIFFTLNYINDVIIKYANCLGWKLPAPISNLIIFGYFSLTFVFTSRFFLQQYFNQNIVKFIKYECLAVFFLIVVSLLLFPDISNRHNQLMIDLVCIHLIILVLFYYYDLTLRDTIIDLLRYPNFWISLGILVWATFFVFRIGVMYYLDQVDRKYLVNLVYQLIYLNIFVNIIYLKGLRCMSQTK